MRSSGSSCRRMWALPQAFESLARSRTTARSCRSRQTPSASVAAPRPSGIQAPSPRRRNPTCQRTRPNVLIILSRRCRIRSGRHLRWPIHTPTLTRIAMQGISYNAFHTTSICSPTRASLLTGRNHQRVGSGTIAERAVDWDGYTGVIPRTSATHPEVLRHYGYKTAAFGKWHNTPRDRTTAMGPVRPMADRRRLRLLLRIPRRRDLAVGAAAVREPQSGRAAARREVPPERRPGGQGDHVAAQAPRLLAGQAVLHVLGARRSARAAPHLQGVGRQVQGKVRRRLGRLARAHLQAPEGTRLDSGGHQAHAARRDHGRLGRASPNPSAPSSGG